MNDPLKTVEQIIEEAENKEFKTLDLKNCQLTSLPETIGNLVNLTELNLYGNQLTSLPETIGNLTNLTRLTLAENQLTSLPETIGNLTSLTCLDLFNNQLTKLPKSLGNLVNLNYLYLSHNQLTSLPETIGHLVNLTELILYENKLTILPKFLGNLVNLNHLDLSHNQLTSLPETIGHLVNLTQLNLYANQLKTLPESLGNLDKLTELKILGNTLETPPIEITNKGIEPIKEYFRQLKEEGTDYLYEAKLLIVGEGGAGKTTLANKIQNPDYQLQEEDPTQGIEVKKWHFKMENGQNFRVNIWDFGGQEIYHATHQFFLSKRSLYILVADTRKQDTDFYYWLNVVKLLSENSPLLIIKNERYDKVREINEPALRGQFCNLEEILATNLANNRGLADILTKIKFYIQHLPHVGSALPTTWKKVRTALEKDSRNYISFDEYLRICDQNEFTQHKNKLQLSGYLHDLGVCLHFQDDPLLRKTVILKPGWGTTAVYKVLDNPTVIGNKGRFNRTDLTNIWHEEQYAYMQDELLQLMIKFKLCYKIPDNQDNYIAPQLLSVEQPDYPWDESNNLILRYTYDQFMPKGIISQFIVVMHRWIDQQQYVWRNGVILNKDNTKAEVIENYYKREIKIRIVGIYKRDLMTNIIYELDNIHDSYKELKYSKLIPCNCFACKDSQSPHFYSFEVLRHFATKRLNMIQCHKSGEMVNVLSLIDDLPLTSLEKKSVIAISNFDNFQDEELIITDYPVKNTDEKQNIENDELSTSEGKT